MKVIIPLAGKGTRLRPHTHTKAKPLVNVAGKPVLAHILDSIKDRKDIDEIIFTTGHLGQQIQDFVVDNYDFKSVFIEQKELTGQSTAVKLAEGFVDKDVLIWFVDTISDPDLDRLTGLKGDGLIYVKEVADPSRFGVVVTKGGKVTELIEKPDKPLSNLVNIGLYYVRDSKRLFDAINDQIERKLQTHGEYYLMDAFQIMIDKGAVFEVEEVSVWEDCGKADALLKTNRYFLDHGKSAEFKGAINSIIIPPVNIHPSAHIEKSIIGPYVSISEKCRIHGSIIADSIINEGSAVDSARLKQSVIGASALVKGVSKRLNVGDSSEIVFGG